MTDDTPAPMERALLGDAAAATTVLKGLKDLAIFTIPVAEGQKRKWLAPVSVDEESWKRNGKILVDFFGVELACTTEEPHYAVLVHEFDLDYANVCAAFMQMGLLPPVWLALEVHFPDEDIKPVKNLLARACRLSMAIAANEMHDRVNTIDTLLNQPTSYE